MTRSALSFKCVVVGSLLVVGWLALFNYGGIAVAWYMPKQNAPGGLVSASAGVYAAPRGVLASPVMTVVEPFLLILVITSPHDAQHRQLRRVIRQTWAKQCGPHPGDDKDELDCRVVFVVGKMGHTPTDRLMLQEYKEERDVLITDTTDSYKNLTAKLMASLRWASRVRPRYVVKVDDDVFLNANRLLGELSLASVQSRQLYAGRVFYDRAAERDQSHRHYVSVAAYPRPHFPPYCAGGMYIIDGRLLDRLLAATMQTPYVMVEDVYMGLLMNRLGVEPSRWQTIWLHEFLPQFSRLFFNRCEYATLAGLGHRMTARDLEQVHSLVLKYEGKDRGQLRRCWPIHCRVALACGLVVLFAVALVFGVKNQCAVRNRYVNNSCCSVSRLRLMLK